MDGGHSTFRASQYLSCDGIRLRGKLYQASSASVIFLVPCCFGNLRNSEPDISEGGHPPFESAYPMQIYQKAISAAFDLESVNSLLMRQVVHDVELPALEWISCAKYLKGALKPCLERSQRESTKLPSQQSAKELHLD